MLRTLHWKVYTNDKLFKMGRKSSDICMFCTISIDGVKHMLFICPKTA